MPAEIQNGRLCGREVLSGIKVILGHFAINHKPTRGSIWPCNIAGLISEVSEKVSTQIVKNCSRRQPHSHVRPPPRETPANCACTLYFQKLQSSAYIFVAACMGLYLYSNLCSHCSGLQQTHLFWNSVILAVQGRSGSSKVDDFGTNRKRIGYTTFC